jgi:hypothetical protein
MRTAVGRRPYDSRMRPDERAVLERAIRRVTEQAANANAIVDEAMGAGLDGSEPFVVNTKRLRAELLSVKRRSPWHRYLASAAARF